VLGSIAVIAAFAGTAQAARTLITGSQIKNGTITGADVKTGSLTGINVKNGSIGLYDLTAPARLFLHGAIGRTGAAGATGATGATGLTGERGPSGPAAAGAEGPAGPTGATGPAGPAADAGFTSEVWGVIDRNSYGSPVSQGRMGPLGRTGSGAAAYAATVAPPFGTGSLSVLVDNDPTVGGGQAEKLSFGNEKDFAGLKLVDVTTLGLWIYATGEDEQPAAAVISPGITMEVDPNGAANTAAPGYTSLVYVPEAPLATSTWLQYDATVGAHWFATGAFGTSIGCNQAHLCTLAELKTALPAAEVSYSIAITKGRDTSFLGAVDGLRINGAIYDFESLGVRKITAP
jgi:hypothetical protein